MRVGHDRFEIHVRDTAYFYPEVVCLQVRAPYTRVANVGILRSGNYRVIFEGPAGIKLEQEPVPVAQAISSEPDDFLYASVAEAFVERSSSGNGVTHADCMAALLSERPNRSFGGRQCEKTDTTRGNRVCRDGTQRAWRARL